MVQSQDIVAECPTCKAIVPLDATECPQCGELFDDDGTGETPIAIDRQESGRPAAEGSTDERKTGVREKFLCYTGIFLILLGGPAIVLGCWLLDELQIGLGAVRPLDGVGRWNRLV